MPEWNSDDRAERNSDRAEWNSDQDAEGDQGHFVLPCSVCCIVEHLHYVITVINTYISFFKIRAYIKITRTGKKYLQHFCVKMSEQTLNTCNTSTF